MAKPHTVHNVLIACGVDNAALFMDQTTQAQRTAEDIFDNVFM
jgi:hypothetical protein